METRNLVIIGSGPAGCTAAIYSARAGFNPLVLHGDCPGGQLTTTTDIENFPGWKGTGPDLMEFLEHQAEEAGAEFRYGTVKETDFSTNPKKLVLDSGDVVFAQSVILATGATANYLGLPNEKRLMGLGVSGCATCDGPLYKGKDVCVVGGGDAAVEEALFLSRICKSCTLIHRRDQLRASLPMRKRLEESTIKVIWNTVIEDILGEERVTGLRIKNVQTGEVSEMQTEGLFVAIGHTPATQAFSEWIDLDDMHYIVCQDGTETKVPGVFACGDCMDKHYRQAVTSAGTGCQAALQAEKYLQDIH